MIISGIYKIQSKIKSERIYIGSSCDIIHRWQEHSRKLKLGVHKNPKLQHHINKYGFTDLQFSILVGCDKENLITNEQFFLDSLTPWFNIHKKADSPLGLKRSEKSRGKMSARTRGEGNGFYGKHHSEESKQAKRDWNLKNGVKPPIYHGGRPIGAKNKLKFEPINQN